MVTSGIRFHLRFEGCRTARQERAGTACKRHHRSESTGTPPPRFCENECKALSSGELPCKSIFHFRLSKSWSVDPLLRENG